MNNSTSEYSSGCESGWTMYFDQSPNSTDRFPQATSEFKAENVEEYDEDLSMVSDASSGPPHFQEDEDSFDENGYHCRGTHLVSQQPNKKEKNNKKVKEQRSKKQYSNLADTASSPVKKHLAIPPGGGVSMEHNIGFSHGFSATHFKPEKSALRKHVGFIHSSVPEKPASGASGGLQGRRWE